MFMGWEEGLAIETLRMGIVCIWRFVEADGEVEALDTASTKRSVGRYLGKGTCVLDDRTDSLNLRPHCDFHEPEFPRPALRRGNGSKERTLLLFLPVTAERDSKTVKSRRRLSSVLVTKPCAKSRTDGDPYILQFRYDRISCQET